MTRVTGLSRALLLACAIVLALSVASTAFAETPSDVLTIGALEQKLAGTEPVFGYFKTVVKGSTTATFPVQILALTGEPGAADTLIMFESKGDLVAKYGGIVSGMSGSPIYVEDEGTPKIVGAVSYGDIFTMHGTGLATPIELMLAIKSDFVTEQLSEPVITSAGVINSVIVSPDAENYAGMASAGTLVAKPLASMFIGGMSPNDKAYKKLSGLLTKEGFSVAPIGATLGGAGMAAQSVEATGFEPGSAVAMLGARGDLWYGGLGTVSYVDTQTDDVFAFGHPAFWDGETDMFMMNATIDGIWPSTYFPYKMGRPTALAGAFTQDRWPGIMGVYGQFPAETTVTATAVCTDANASVAATSSTVVLSERLVNSLYGAPFLAGYSAYPAGGRIYDSYYEPGSAKTTTTVEVYDPDTDTTYDVVMTNIVDSADDISFAILDDAWMAVDSIVSIGWYGIESPVIKSVDLQSEISRNRTNSELVGIELPTGLKTGDNTVVVTLRDHGVASTYTEEATLTIPEGMPLMGTISASAADYYDWEEEEEDAEEPAPENTIPTILDTVNALEGAAPNNQVNITFTPLDLEGAATDELTVATTALLANGPAYGSTSKDVTQITVARTPSTSSYGGYSIVYGLLKGVSSGKVRVFVTPYGESSFEITPSVDALIEYEEWPEYAMFLEDLEKNTVVKVRYEGSRRATACEATIAVNVKPYVALSSPSRARKGAVVTLKAAIMPTSTAGTYVRFEKYNTATRKWVAISSVPRLLVVDAARPWQTIASMSFKLTGTTKVRVTYLGGASNVLSSSSARTITAY